MVGKMLKEMVLNDNVQHKRIKVLATLDESLLVENATNEIRMHFRGEGRLNNLRSDLRWITEIERVCFNSPEDKLF